jgi:hypothetical protein
VDGAADELRVLGRLRPLGARLPELAGGDAFRRTSETELGSTRVRLPPELLPLSLEIVRPGR